MVFAGSLLSQSGEMQKKGRRIGYNEKVFALDFIPELIYSTSTRNDAT